jgi:hypothetical protein
MNTYVYANEHYLCTSEPCAQTSSNALRYSLVSIQTPVCQSKTYKKYIIWLGNLTVFKIKTYSKGLVNVFLRSLIKLLIHNFAIKHYLQIDAQDLQGHSCEKMMKKDSKTLKLTNQLKYFPENHMQTKKIPLRHTYPPYYNFLLYPTGPS